SRLELIGNSARLHHCKRLFFSQRRRPCGVSVAAHLRPRDSCKTCAWRRRGARQNRVILAYLGPADHISAIAEVTGNAFDIRCVNPEPAAVADILRTATALLDASMRVRVTRQMIESAPALRIVATATTGADHIDSHALHDRGIPLVTLRGQHDLLNKLT